MSEDDGIFPIGYPPGGAPPIPWLSWQEFNEQIDALEPEAAERLAYFGIYQAPPEVNRR